MYEVRLSNFMHSIKIVPREVRLQFVCDFLDEVWKKKNKNYFNSVVPFLPICLFYQSNLYDMLVLQWIFTRSYSWQQWIKHNCACPKFFLATPSCLRVPTFSFSPFASDPTHISCTVSLMRGYLYQNILEVLSEWTSYGMWALGSWVLIKSAFLW